VTREEGGPLGVTWRESGRTRTFKTPDPRFGSPHCICFSFPSEVRTIPLQVRAADGGGGGDDIGTIGPRDEGVRFDKSNISVLTLMAQGFWDISPRRSAVEEPR